MLNDRCQRLDTWQGPDQNLLVCEQLRLLIWGPSIHAERHALAQIQIASHDITDVGSNLLGTIDDVVGATLNVGSNCLGTVDDVVDATLNVADST